MRNSIDSLVCAISQESSWQHILNSTQQSKSFIKTTEVGVPSFIHMIWKANKLLNNHLGQERGIQKIFKVFGGVVTIPYKISIIWTLIFFLAGLTHSQLCVWKTWGSPGCKDGFETISIKRAPNLHALNIWQGSGGRTAKYFVNPQKYIWVWPRINCSSGDNYRSETKIAWARASWNLPFNEPEILLFCQNRPPSSLILK